MLTSRLAPPSILLALAPALWAQAAPRTAPREGGGTAPAITVADLTTRLSIFADDSLQGREAGTAGNAKGTSYIARELARLGLQPAGDSGSFFQTVPLEVQRLDPATRMAVGDSALRFGVDYLILPGGVGGLPRAGGRFAATGVPAIYGGRLGEATTLAPDAATGRLVILRVGGTQGPVGPEAFLRYERSAGILIVLPAAQLRQFAQFLDRPQVRLKTEEVAPAEGEIPYLVLTPEGAQAIMGAPLEGLVAGATGRAVTVAGGFTMGPPDQPGRNVVAVVPGRDPARRGEYVAFGAHNDHEGIERPVDHDSLRAFNTVVRPGGAEDMGNQPSPAQRDTVRRLLDSLRKVHPPRRDSIMNGADDDGSGSMALLELAEFFQANPPRRSLLFVWHVAEEKGLFGSEWFTDHPTVARDSIVTQLNVDMIGRGSAGDIEGGGPGYLQLIGSRRLSTELGDLVERVNRDGKHGFTFDYQFDADGHPAQYYCRSDHYEYARYGIPITFFTTGSHRDYHMVTDEVQYINFEKYARVVTLIRDVGRAVADLDHRVVVDRAKPDPTGPCRQ